MSVVAAFMVPHPPMIVPNVGKGSEKQVLETTRAYERVADEVATLRPEVIIITSPHSVMYADYFHISPSCGASGSFRQFRAPEVSFAEQYDMTLVRRICDLAEAADLPAGTLGERDAALDHGTMVPLWFIRQKYREGKIVRIGLSGLSLTDHYALGTYIRQTAEELGRNTVIVASGDLSHKLQEYGPYGFDPAGPVYDEKIMAAAAQADFGGMLAFDEELLDKAAECGHRSFVIMAGTLDGCDVRAEVLSHQDVTGVGYGLCIFTPEGRNEKRRFLKALADRVADQAEDASAYVRLARAAIEKYVTTRRRLAFPTEISEDILRDLPAEATRERAGAFVSVHKNGALRGCIGTIAATEDCIAEEIIGNAISAVSRDPRFDRVREDELGLLEINVDILGKPEYIKGPAELDVRRYGVIVSCGMKRGLLLPDLEGVDTVEDQIRIAMRKGGISPSDDYRLQRFEVVRYT